MWGSQLPHTPCNAAHCLWVEGEVHHFWQKLSHFVTNFYLRMRESLIPICKSTKEMDDVVVTRVSMRLNSPPLEGWRGATGWF